MKKLENREPKKAYPLMPYLVGLFIMVIFLVLLSYLVDLRNRGELCTYEEPHSYITECANLEF